MSKKESSPKLFACSQSTVLAEKIAKEYGAKIITTKKDFVKIKKINAENINFLKIDLKVKNLENLIKFLELNI